MSAQDRHFFIATSSGTTSGRKRAIGSIIGHLSVSKKQTQKLEVKAYTQWSPYLEKCCLLLSANVSYERIEKLSQCRPY
jgi:hypothetical protein